jgi:hypothetical protein
MGDIQKMRGLKLLAAYYEEIVDAVPQGTMSTAEILGAAKALIECSREDYIDVHHQDAVHTPGYFSYNLCVAFDQLQGRILLNEVGVSDDELTHLNTRNLSQEVCSSWAA